MLHIALWLLTALAASAHVPRSMLELTPGTHQLVVTAAHPSALFFTNASSWFTNAAGSDRAVNSYDPSGLLTNRVWFKSNGQTNRAQTLAWDARGRLWKVTDRDTNNSGFTWQAVYDALGRRLQTLTTPVSNGVAFNAQASTIAQFFDPEVTFLELAVSVNGQTTWKLYGPDASGTYGGAQGVGGLEAVSDSTTTGPVIRDARGNVVGVHDAVQGLKWSAARPTGYGGVPGYRPPALAANVSFVESIAWRGLWGDVTGLSWRGHRYYDSVAGMWMSPDPLGHSGGSDNLMSAYNGDPINWDDPEGLLGKGAFNAGSDLVTGAGQLLYNVGGTIGYGYTSIFNSEAAENTYGQQRADLFGAVKGIGQTLYDVGGSVGYTLTGDDQYYGASADRLYGVTSALSGGDDNSTAYRVGYTGAQIAALVYGGQALNAGRAGEAGLFAERAAVAAEGTTALSPYRVTTAGETFSHYGYAENAASFQGGLRPGGFATSAGNLSGVEAQSGLALPRPTAPPNAVYTVTPQPGTWIRANPVTAPKFGQPGGLPEYQFPGGTGPGTVSPPRRIP